MARDCRNLKQKNNLISKIIYNFTRANLKTMNNNTNNSENN